MDSSFNYLLIKGGSHPIYPVQPLTAASISVEQIAEHIHAAPLLWQCNHCMRKTMSFVLAPECWDIVLETSTKHY